MPTKKAQAAPDAVAENGDQPEEHQANGRPQSEDAALFIDWENLKWSLRDIGRVPNISSILDAARERGRVVVARAYADWQQGGHHLDPPNLYRAGISPVYIPSRMGGEGKVLKNSADVKLAVDTIDYANSFRHVKTFVIVSGDADLVHLATYLRMQGKYVVAIGISGASSTHLADSVDEFLLYDIDIEPASTAPSRQPARQGVQEKRAMQRMLNNLVSVVKRESRNGQGALFSVIANELRHRYDFQPRRFGVSGFKQFMRQAENEGAIKIVTEGMQDWAFLPEDVERMEREEEEEGTPRQVEEDVDNSVKLTDLDRDDLYGFLRYIANLEDKSKYLRMPYVVANLRSRSILPSLSRAQLKSLLRDAQSQGVLRESSREVKRHTTGEPMELDTLELNRQHPLVAEALRETPTESSAGAA
ncbi:MAG TPA: NYN domain-containing protein [Chloroflexota bacterium]|nr:NYN domain-containing protein [Chloroflexota bacterium]